DKKGSQSCSTCYRHLFDVDYHPARWEGIDSNGTTFELNQYGFETLAARWQRREFTDLHRSYYRINGNAYVTVWDNREETLEAVTTAHTYKNKVPASTSVYRFADITPEQKTRFGLYDYPPIQGWNQTVI